MSKRKRSTLSGREAKASSPLAKETTGIELDERAYSTSFLIDGSSSTRTVIYLFYPSLLLSSTVPHSSITEWAIDAA